MSGCREVYPACQTLLFVNTPGEWGSTRVSRIALNMQVRSMGGFGKMLATLSTVIRSNPGDFFTRIFQHHTFYSVRRDSAF